MKTSFLPAKMDPRWKTVLTAAIASVIAIACGWWIGNGRLAIPAVVTAACASACIIAAFRLPLDTVVLGGLLLGYVVGNRGFAQISLAPGLPLLPAEAGLALCGVFLVIRSALSKELPFRRDLLNFAVLLWIVVGTARIVQDTREHGVLALRDYAMTYYAAFFFLAQTRVGDDTSRRFLQRCLLVASVAVIPLFELFRRFPEFFIGKLVVAGIPLIYFKGDLVATFMVVSVVLVHRRWELSRRFSWLILALLGLVGVLVSENRASMLALVVVTAFLALRGHRALLRTQLVGLALASLVLLGAIAMGAISGRNNPGVVLYERIVSIADISGQRTYTSEVVEFKGDNNRYRLVWWEAVIDETLAGNPWLGLGFGHDLAAAFVRRYYPDSSEEFSVRSPHSIFVTVFGRIGAIGLAALLAIVVGMARQTWRSLRRETYHDDATGCWLATWVILVSACFGVVLEGPMGAVVFWTVLGMANGTTRATGEAAESVEAAGQPSAMAQPVTS